MVKLETSRALNKNKNKLIKTFGTFNDRSIAETAANAAPAGLPTCPVAFDPLVPGEGSWGDTEEAVVNVGDAAGNSAPAFATVLRIGCFCRFI